MRRWWAGVVRVYDRTLRGTLCPGTERPKFRLRVLDLITDSVTFGSFSHTIHFPPILVRGVYSYLDFPTQTQIPRPTQ